MAWIERDMTTVPRCGGATRKTPIIVRSHDPPKNAYSGSMSCPMKTTSVTVTEDHTPLEICLRAGGR